ncbi:MAG: hypothetical protein AAGC78_13235 [Cellvibrio sp.]|uniref:hypothetical protein n=1 Tax=Cellvibrio sp. TaxID=1965322 RepID=UPI0031A0A354
MSLPICAQSSADHADVEVDHRLLLSFANRGLLASALVLLLTVLVCYPYAEWFSLEAQIFGHAAMILSAVLIKLTYLLRCIAQQALHLPVG